MILSVLGVWGKMIDRDNSFSVLALRLGASLPVGVWDGLI